MSDPVILPAPSAATQMPRQAKDAVTTAREFEAVFIGQMTKLMMETVDTGSFSGGHGEAMFRGVLAEEMGNAIARNGGVGIAPSVMAQIIKMQGQSSDGR